MKHHDFQILSTLATFLAISIASIGCKTAERSSSLNEESKLIPTLSKNADGTYKLECPVWAPGKQVYCIPGIGIERKKAAPTVVYLHGLGDHASQAYSELQSEIENDSVLKQFNWLFLDCEKQSWFTLSENKDDVQESLGYARESLGNSIRVAGLDRTKVIWAGFSLGAITATDYVLHTEKVRPLGLVVNSGSLYPPAGWKAGNQNLKGMPFYINHDPKDDTLEWEGAEELEKFLLSLEMKGSLTKSSQGHKIPKGLLGPALQQMGVVPAAK